MFMLVKSPTVRMGPIFLLVGFCLGVIGVAMMIVGSPEGFSGYGVESETINLQFMLLGLAAAFAGAVMFTGGAIISAIE